MKHLSITIQILIWVAALLLGLILVGYCIATSTYSLVYCIALLLVFISSIGLTNTCAPIWIKMYRELLGRKINNESNKSR